MNKYEIINQIPIKSILDLLKIPYRLDGSVLCLFHEGERTDGWIGSSQGNYINDFSCKGRAKGPPFAFVRTYLGLDSKQTFERFQNNFGIGNSVIKKIKKTYKKREVQKYLSYHNNR